MNLGKKVNSFSGFFDGVINFVFRYFSDDTSTLDTAVSTGDVLTAGKEIGKLFRLFFSTEVSSYQRDYVLI